MGYHALESVYNRIAVLAFAWFMYNKTVEIFQNTGQTLEDNLHQVQSLSNQSLFIQHELDYQERLRNRKQNINKWQQHHGGHFEYDESGIDRRSNLSLEEFWDVYDGTW